MFVIRRFLPQLSSQGRSVVTDTMSAGVISYDELQRLKGSGKGQIFDVRSPDEVEKGKIPNSVNIPVNDFENALKLDPETFKNTYGVNKPSLQDEDFVVHCQMGRRGARAADIAAAIGYKHVRNYAGGFKEWSEKGGN